MECWDTMPAIAKELLWYGYCFSGKMVHAYPMGVPQPQDRVPCWPSNAGNQYWDLFCAKKAGWY